MKEIKAYIRPDVLQYTVDRLEESGAKDITVVHVDAVGTMADVAKDAVRLFRKYHKKYSVIAKLELVCPDEQADMLMAIIRDTAHTGKFGDGRVFLGPVERVINIRTGEEGEGAL